MDCSTIKSKMTLNDYKKIFNDMRLDIVEETSQYILMYQYDRYSVYEIYDHKKKLYFYIESAMFKNYISGESYDIFTFILKYNNLNGIDTSFQDVVKNVNDYATGKCSGFSYGNIKKYTRNLYKPTFTVYDESILNFLPKEPPQDWLNQGISEAACDEFNIRQYPRLSQIVIPVYSNAQFIGARVRNNRPDLIEAQGKYHPLSLMCGKIFSFSTNGCFYGMDNVLKAIGESQSVILVEGEKSCLKSRTIFGDDSIAVGMFGKSLSQYKRKLLKDAGVKTVYYCADADFTNEFERQEWLAELKRWVQPLLADGFNVYIVADWEQEYVCEKDNIFDTYDINDFKEIWKKKIKM